MIEINKKNLIQKIIGELSNKLNQSIASANEAHAAAVDDQSVAETQYDTLAIEASYLAEGQSRRVQKYHVAIECYQSLACKPFDKNSTIELTALIQLSKDKIKRHWFFIGPDAGGFACQLNQQFITVITPDSPMGLAILGKQKDDDIEVIVGSNKLIDYIYEVQ